MPLNNIDRISSPSSETFLQDYILAQQPVILTNLFDDASLRTCTTVAQAQRDLVNIPIGISPNYIAELLHSSVKSDHRQMPIQTFLDWLVANPETMDACTEYPTPPELQAQFPLTRYRHLQDEQDLYSNLFIAGSQNYAHLHYDADQRDVLLYQVFGVKRVILIHPQQTQKLDPIHRADLRRTSSIFLEQTTESEKTSFCHYTQAWDTFLYPGETIYMPAMFWHYLEYLELAMSIGYRLGRNSYNQRLAKLFPAPSVDVQAMAISLLNETVAQSNHRDWLEQLEIAHQAPIHNASEHQLALERLCLEIRRDRLGLEPIYNIREWGRRRSFGIF